MPQGRKMAARCRCSIRGLRAGRPRNFFPAEKTRRRRSRPSSSGSRSCRRREKVLRRRSLLHANRGLAKRFNSHPAAAGMTASSRKKEERRRPCAEARRPTLGAKAESPQGFDQDRVFEHVGETFAAGRRCGPSASPTTRQPSRLAPRPVAPSNGRQGLRGVHGPPRRGGGARASSSKTMCSSLSAKAGNRQSAR